MLNYTAQIPAVMAEVANRTVLIDGEVGKLQTTVNNLVGVSDGETILALQTEIDRWNREQAGQNEKVQRFAKLGEGAYVDMVSTDRMLAARFDRRA